MEQFSDLAARVAAGVSELRGCLILSREGLVLGASPERGTALAKSAWLRFAIFGVPEKGFVDFGDEVWGYVRRGPYAVFAVTGPAVGAGLLDRLEQMVLAAEATPGRPDPSPTPTTTTPAPGPAAPGPRLQIPDAPSGAVRPDATVAPTASRAVSPGAPEGHSNSVPVPPPRPQQGEEDGPGEVDRVMLAREFSRLLQEAEGGDET